MKDIAIYGAGGFGREVAMLVEQINQHTPSWNLTGFYDDGLVAGTAVYGYKVLGGLPDLNNTGKELSLVIGIADPEIKKKIITQISNPYISYPVLFHPTALAGQKDVRIGEGSIITAGAILTVNIHIGVHVIINLSCTIGHDAVIGDYSSLMPAVNISGEVEIGEGVFIGTGANIINQLKVGAATIIGAGAVVTESLPAHCTAVGVPAKPIKFHQPQSKVTNLGKDFK